MVHVAVSGLGNTGIQVAKQLETSAPVSSLRLYDPDRKCVALANETVGSKLDTVDAQPRKKLNSYPHPAVAVFCGPSGTHLDGVERLLEAGCHIVSLSDDPADIEALLDLDELAKENNSTILAGAGFCPGLSTVLASYGAAQLDSVEAINISTTGTGGPACARQHHRALKNTGVEWADGSWHVRRGRSGRDLVWFPDPIGARDCYRAALADPLLIQLALPDAARIGARMSANRRDRLTRRLPMLRRPHADGGWGAIRAEVRGTVEGRIETLIYGVAGLPSSAAATVAAVCTQMLTQNTLPHGAYGLASFPDPVEFLLELYKRGIVVASFDGYLRSSGLR